MPIEFLFQLFKRRINLNRAKLPFKLVVATTFACNSRCRNCHIWKVYQDDQFLKKSELKLADFVKLFQEVKDTLLFLELTGGEPFSRQDISDILQSAGEILPKYTYIGVTTNGFSTRKIIDVAKQILPEIKQPLVLAVSLDGIPQVHDRVRGIDGAFDKALKTYLELKNLQKDYANFFPHLSYTIFPENAGRLREFLDYIKKHYVIEPAEVSISYCQQSNLYHLAGKIKTDENYDIKAKQDIVYFNEIAQREKTKNFFLRAKNRFKIFYLDRLIQFIDQPKKMVIPCTALSASAYIDPYGTVYPCIEWDKPLGNLKNNTLGQIRASSKVKQVRMAICQKKCPNCWTVCEAQPSYLMRWPWL